MAEDNPPPNPPQDGGPPEEGGKAPAAKTAKSQAVRVGAAASLGMGGWEAVQQVRGQGSFGLNRAAKLSSGGHGAVIAPVTYVNERKVEQGDTLRSALNQIRGEVNRFAHENDVLAGNVDLLQEDTNRMKECASALKEIAGQQQADLDRLNELIKENKEIAAEMRKILIKKRIEEIVTIVLECDLDFDFKLKGNGIDELFLQLDQYDDFNLDTDLIRKTIEKNDGDMKMALRIIYRLLPEQYLDPDDEDGTWEGTIATRSMIGDFTVAEDMTVYPGQSRAGQSRNTQATGMTMRTFLLSGDNKDKSPVLGLLEERDTIDFLKDDPASMTRGRRIALRLMKYKFYYPLSDGESKLRKIPKNVDDSDESDEKKELFEKEQEEKKVEEKEFEDNKSTESKKAKDPNAPSLEKAWAFFEHNSLPRHLFVPKPEGWKKPGIVTRILHKMNKANKQLERAEPGEWYRETKLYSPRDTPLKQMGDFGIGIGLYFSTLRYLSVLTLIAAGVSFVQIMYFISDEYSDGQKGVYLPVKGSAICTRTKWVICEECDINMTGITPNRLAIGKGYFAGSDMNLTLALKNDCPTPDYSYLSFAIFCLMTIGLLVMEVFQKRMEVNFDEDEQTTQDYSIVIRNPPDDAKDPKEWKEFFESKYDDIHVTCCTVGLNNEHLLQTLVTRREVLRKIRYKLPLGTELDKSSLEKIAQEIENDRNCIQKLKAKIFHGIPEWFNKLQLLESTIVDLSKLEYRATAVFITFETEGAQRKVLASMHNHEFNFRDEYKIFVDEAEEPSSVRWQYLSVRKREKAKFYFFTTLATLAGLFLAAAVVIIMKREKMSMTAVVIALCNQVFPRFALFLTHFEKHSSRDKLEVSLYIKIVVFRWINTAIVTTIASEFTETIEPEGLIPSIFTIFLAEIITTNVFQLLDLGGNFKRHIIAPRARSQEEMNNCMMGSEYYIAERYTNVTKILFLTFWYSTVYPTTYLLCSIALTINYFSDRYSLMRTWRQIGKIGSHISIINRRVFCSLALLGFAINASYQFAGFPFDNLCQVSWNYTDPHRGNSTVHNDTNLFTGNMNIHHIVTKDILKERRFMPDTKDYMKKNLTVTPINETYTFCNQDMMKYGDAFPPLSAYQIIQWMTKDQDLTVTMFSIASLAMIGLIFFTSIIKLTKDKFCGTNREFVGEDQNIPFSTLETQSGYVPEALSLELPYPLVACDLKAFDHELFEWCNPEQPYSYYDLTEDVRVILRSKMESVDVSAIFSSILHTPPPKEK